MRVPFCAGVAGGVGVTVISHALRAADEDLHVPESPVDILVCRTTTDSVGQAHRALATALYRPVLAVVADVPEGARLKILPSAVRARLRMIEPHVAGMVAVPFVPRWREVDDPCQEAAYVLAPGSDVPRDLRDFAAAMRQLSEQVQPVLREQADRVASLV